jgi:alanyl-tRNA synthetase
MHNSSAAAVRQAFLDFFVGHGHTRVKSSPLVPAGDATLMFTNAGMVQFKDVFVGAEARPYSRATSVQKCMRVSGKHNDLEEVGRTARHHTLFEMLGNFSFGDYFKEQAIHYAWTLLTKTYGLDRDRLWVTVFGGADGIAPDHEARALWRKISGLPDARILDCGMKDNFWSMGDTGPCGPCSEIHYDQGQGPVSRADFDNGRVMEIWNNVFMQFDRQADGTYVPLPAPSVDTGMGLERLVALLQGHSSNYHSDLFMPLVQQAAELSHKAYSHGAGEDDVSMRVIADHARATAFLVADGVQPANEGRGYVLRRIMRRAIRHGRRLGIEPLFLGTMAQRVVETMGMAYPELIEAQSLLGKVVELEETSFRHTLDTGLSLLDEALGRARLAPKPQLAGELVFRLYDTYGFPKDLTEVIAGEAGVAIDEAGFAQSMQAQKARSRSAGASQGADLAAYRTLLRQVGPTDFIGYPHENVPLSERPGTWRHSTDGGAFLEAEVRVVGLVVDGAPCEVAHATDAAQAVEVILAPTPFYGESGGQVGDSGRLCDADGPAGALQAEVLDTQRPLGELTVQHVQLRRGQLAVGQTLWAGYRPHVRRQIRAHHSATHLLHGALRDVLGGHVKQAGSRVAAEQLRFDFTHFAALTPAQLQAVEADANDRIAAATPVHIAEMTYDEAKGSGAIALFGEKYGDRVRVLTMGASVELCGGTHAHNTAELELLLIVREEAVQSGVRRIEARVGSAAQAAVDHMRERLHAIAQALAGRLPADAKHSAEAQVILATRLRSQLDADHTALQAQGQSVAPLPQVAPAEAALGMDTDAQTPLQRAQRVRGLWQRTGQLMQARPTEVQAMLEAWRAEGPLDQLLVDLAALTAAGQANARQLQGLAHQSLAGEAKLLAAQAEQVGGVRLVCAQVQAQGAEIRRLADGVRDALGSAVICLGAVQGARATLVLMVTADLTKRVSAGRWVGELAQHIDGRGGGKPEFAQAGGNNPAGLAAAFAELRQRLEAL